MGAFIHVVVTCCLIGKAEMPSNRLQQTSHVVLSGWLPAFPGFGSFFIIYYLEENVRNFPLESMPVGFITFLNFNDSTCSLAHPFYSNASISSKSQEERKL